MTVLERFQNLQPKQQRIIGAGIVILIVLLIILITRSGGINNPQNTKRTSDISAILNAVHAYVEDDANSNNFPTGIPSVPNCAAPDAEGNAPAGALDVGTSSANLEKTLVKQYIDAIPHDPDSGSNEKTGYKICSDSATNAITVWAVNTEPASRADLKVTR